MAVQVSTEVFEGLERVRHEGHTNMLDRDMVQRLAHENEDYATVIWLEDNKNLYTQGIFAGFELVDEKPARKEG